MLQKCSSISNGNLTSLVDRKTMHPVLGLLVVNAFFICPERNQWNSHSSCWWYSFFFILKNTRKLSKNCKKVVTLARHLRMIIKIITKNNFLVFKLFAKKKNSFLPAVNQVSVELTLNLTICEHQPKFFI